MQDDSKVANDYGISTGNIKSLFDKYLLKTLTSTTQILPGMQGKIYIQDLKQTLDINLHHWQ